MRVWDFLLTQTFSLINVCLYVILSIWNYVDFNQEHGIDCWLTCSTQLFTTVVNLVTLFFLMLWQTTNIFLHLQIILPDCGAKPNHYPSLRYLLSVCISTSFHVSFFCVFPEMEGHISLCFLIIQISVGNILQISFHLFVHIQYVRHHWCNLTKTHKPFILQ